MTSPHRRMLLTLAVMALLWQLAGGVFKTIMPCCLVPQACCQIVSPLSSCASCVPGPVAAGQAPELNVLEAVAERPERHANGKRATLEHTIWRPPMPDALSAGPITPFT